MDPILQKIGKLKKVKQMSLTKSRKECFLLLEFFKFSMTLNLNDKTIYFQSCHERF